MAGELFPAFVLFGMAAALYFGKDYILGATAVGGSSGAAEDKVSADVAAPSQALVESRPRTSLPELEQEVKGIDIKPPAIGGGGLGEQIAGVTQRLRASRANAALQTFSEPVGTLQNSTLMLLPTDNVSRDIRGDPANVATGGNNARLPVAATEEELTREDSVRVRSGYINSGRPAVPGLSGGGGGGSVSALAPGQDVFLNA